MHCLGGLVRMEYVLNAPYSVDGGAPQRTSRSLYGHATVYTFYDSRASIPRRPYLSFPTTICYAADKITALGVNLNDEYCGIKL